MSRALKWILGILGGLVDIALIAGLAVAVFGGYRYGFGMMRPGLIRAFPMPGYHMRFGYGGLGLLFGSLLCLGVILLVIVGIVALEAALTRGSRAAPVAPATAVPPASAVTTPERPCPNCGRMTQEDWKTCPYCGTALT
jgi:hypothetical protein